jgi:nitroreductase
MGKLSGDDFVGCDEIENLDLPVRVVGTTHVSRVIRRGERFGNADGEEIGGVYVCGALALEADRNGVDVCRGEQWMHLEPRDRIFIERLLDDGIVFEQRGVG